MEWYWILGIAFVVYFVSGLIADAYTIEDKRGNSASSIIVGALASILFVLIMIYDKL